MAFLQRKNLIFGGGERFPILRDESGIPDFYATLFTTVTLRPANKQNTIFNALQAIVHLKLWEEMEGRDLIAEFSGGRFLSAEDVLAIRDHCALETRELRKWLTAVSQKKVVSIAGRVRRDTKDFNRVSKAHQSNRITHIADYLAFSSRALLRTRARYKEFLPQIENMRRQLLAHRPKGVKRFSVSDPDLKAPPPKVFDALMEVVKEDNPENPFKNPFVRLRNCLIFEIMYAAGFRAGEILALQIEDIDFSGKRIHIKRRHDNAVDPRRHQPVVKTLERAITVPEELVHKIRHYIMSVRAGVPGANKHPFVFVSHHAAKSSQGMPISDSAFRNRILAPATRTNPEIFDEVKRHGFRHNFNYRLSKRIDAQNERAKKIPGVKKISEKEEMQIRMYLNGWKSESSASIYNLRHVKEVADELMLADALEQGVNISRGDGKHG